MQPYIAVALLVLLIAFILWRLVSAIFAFWNTF
jgi:hypothetical protein